jgi:four helix bundle protein
MSFKFEDLIVYKETISFIDLVYKITKNWPKEELYGLTDQFRRAAVSIGLNIAEGSSRKKVEFGHFLDMARGSDFECVGVLHIALNNKYIDQKQYDQLYEYCEKISKMLNGLKSSLIG